MRAAHFRSLPCPFQAAPQVDARELDQPERDLAGVGVGGVGPRCSVARSRSAVGEGRHSRSAGRWRRRWPWVGRRDQQAVHLVLHQRRHAGHVGHHDRQPRRHRFQQHARHALAGQRRQHEQVVLAGDRQHLWQRPRARQTRSGRRRPGRGALRPGRARAPPRPSCPRSARQCVRRTSWPRRTRSASAGGEIAQPLARVDPADRQQADRRDDLGAAEAGVRPVDNVLRPRWSRWWSAGRAGLAGCTSA